MSEKLESFLFKSISYNMALQMFFRIFSFILNAVLLRHVSTELIGVCNFRLALLYTTVTFLSREPFRRALPTLNHMDPKRWSNFFNTLWLVVPSGLLVSTFFSFIWYAILERPDDKSVPFYTLSIVICAMACILEFCGEPANAIGQMCFLAKQKAVIEASSLLIFHLFFVGLAIAFPGLGSMSYAIARLVYSLIFVSLNSHFILSKHNKEINEKLGFKLTFQSLLPSMNSNNLDSEYLKLIKLYFTQSVYKQILTEGERYLITAFSLLNFSESGIYDIINNLGSLIARFIFLPIEDASYVYFTNSIERGVTYESMERKKSSSDRQLSPKSSFENLLKAVSLIGIIVLVFGQGYSQLLLQIYGGDRLGKDLMCVNMLKLYCVYVYILAINGVTESFFNATMSNSELEKNNKRLISFSAIFLCLAFGLSKLFKIYGFQLANCVNMVIRIANSSIHIIALFSGYSYGHEKFQGKAQGYDIVKCFIPDVVVCIVLGMSFVVTLLSELFLYDGFKLGHLMIGVVCFLSTLVAIFFREKRLKSFVLKFLIKDRSS